MYFAEQGSSIRPTMNKTEENYVPVLTEVHKPNSMKRDLGDYYDFNNKLRIVRINEKPGVENSSFTVCLNPELGKCVRCIAKLLCGSPCRS